MENRRTRRRKKEEEDDEDVTEEKKKKNKSYNWTLSSFFLWLCENLMFSHHGRWRKAFRREPEAENKTLIIII